MQVFGVCIIQLKPQLEKLLKLPPDALTKEIRLTQDLLSLFIDYQIPSDLLTYVPGEGTGADEWQEVESAETDDGSDTTATAAAVAAGGSSAVASVKRHVAAVQGMIKDAEDAELEEQARKAELQKQRALEEESHRTAQSMGAQKPKT